MAKKKPASSKRALIDTQDAGKRYVRRAAGGTSKKSDQVLRSVPADRRTKAKTKIKNSP
jgi:hypothetical protein